MLLAYQILTAYQTHLACPKIFTFAVRDGNFVISMVRCDTKLYKHMLMIAAKKERSSID